MGADSLSVALQTEGVIYLDCKPRFPRSKVHAILRDRSYIGEVPFHDQWYPGKHEALVDLATFRRVQILLGDKTYNAHSSVYGSGMITCGHCGRPIVVEVKTKRTKAGPREYRYYRCAVYRRKGHPNVRVTEATLDAQTLALFDRLRIDDEKVCDWVVKVLRAKTRKMQDQGKTRAGELRRQLAIVKDQRDRLLNLRLLDEINADTFAAKNTELRDREADIALQIEACSRQGSEQADLAIKAFELSQSLAQRWLTADIPEKRHLLEIICLNQTPDGTTLCYEMRKPFDVFAEGLVGKDGRGDWI